MRLQHTKRHWKNAATALLASTIIAAPGQALAQGPAQPTDPAQAPAAAEAQEGEQIVVTAQKRTENLQDVPIAITAITTKTLEDLHVDQFEDYARLVPSLSLRAGGSGGSANGPGNFNVFFRGVSSGENANHSASLPSVGTYLDEQPITTIVGALDVHVFDLARIEALAGPQGTLYGASSQSGTLRLITNRPDLSGTYGAANLEVNSVAHGDWGYLGEGFVNFPISTNVAARIVGWYRHDAGYIDNIRGTMTFNTAGITIDNDDVAEDDYNDVDTYGARAALKIDLDDNWTITPAIMGQRQVSHGSFAEESGLGKLEIMQFNPERSKDRWVQAALTVEGKIGNFDITYAGAYMRRRVESAADYSDYSYFYDNVFGSTFFDNFGNTVSPNQRVEADHVYRKLSQELRIASPADKRLRLVAGLFYQRQVDEIEENYIIDDIADEITVPGTESNIWLTRQDRVDRDYAAFGELSYDITPEITLTAGGRLYKFDNTLEGFFGFNENWFDPGTGTCFGPPQISGTPCTNVDKRTKDNGFVHRLNATWKPNDDLLVYATWSRGFRPGGINRRGTLPPFKPDFLTNYELGTKYSFGRGSHFNITGYLENWDDIQLSFLGASGLTEVRNVGKAQIWGIEADLLLRPIDGLSWSTGISYNHATLAEDFCFIEGDSDCIDDDFGLDMLGEEGDRLPLTARWKGSSQVRYEWDLTSDIEAHVQGLITFEGKRKRDLRPGINDIYGNMDSYAQVDLATGLEKGPWSVDLYVKNLFDVRGQLSKNIQCLETTCGDPGGATALGARIYTTVSRPRTIGLRVGRKF
jgi:outer membrane receptor protein involved in Fe transport